MNDLNSVSIVGRLTRDAELKSTGGSSVCKFSMASNRYKDETNYFDVQCWGKLAESLGQYLVKGKQVAVGGELRQERWQQDGQTRSRVVIVAGSVQLLGGKSESQDRPQGGSGTGW